VTTFLIKFTD